MPLDRLRNDVRLAILTLFAIVTTIAVLPFAVYRMVNGQWAAAAVDVAIASFLVVGCVHVWRGGNAERTLTVTVIAYNVGCLAIANLIGTAGMLWMYPVLLANFMLLGRRVASLISIVGVLALMVGPNVFSDMLQRLIFLTTALVVCLFAFIFAYRTDAQRRQLEELASHDPLTGVHNRRTMERELAIAIETFSRHRTPYGLALLDLDHFKRVNDTFGHEAGDRVLIDFAGLVTRTKRRGDRFFRIGGEEFVLLMPGVDSATLLLVCEHLRECVASELHCGTQRVTVSIGAAILRSNEDGASWLARADDAAYEAKRQGRDRVVMPLDEATAEAASEAASGTVRHIGAARVG